MAEGQALPKPSIIANLPGAIYTVGDQISFTIKLSDPPADHAATSTVTVAIVSIAGKTIETLPALELSPKNNYSAAILPSTSGLGYYTVTASLGETSDPGSNQSSLSFGIVPDPGFKSPQPASPFGVVTHFRRWRRDELPALQAKLGISWFREELDFRQCADRNQVSPLLTLAEKHNLHLAAAHQLRGRQSRRGGGRHLALG